MQMNTFNKKHRLFLTKLFLVLILCVGIFIFSAYFMNTKGADTIGVISDIYMHNMSEESALHFSSTIDLRFSQLETLIASSDMRHYDKDKLKELLTENARNYGFESLAFYTASGHLEPVYGNLTVPESSVSFLTALDNGEKRIDAVKDSSGNTQVIFGLPSAALHRRDAEYTALVAGLSKDYITNTLSLDIVDSPVYSHIIRPDGTYPVENNSSTQGNYFEQLYTDLPNDAEKLVTDIHSALASSQHYSAVLTTHGERLHLHCTKLAYSDWFLMVNMPYSTLDKEISRLNHSWLYMEIGGCIIIIAALFWVFGAYLQEMKEQVVELNRLSQEAVYANKAKSEFLSNMSHDIRTPMNAITGMTAIAMREVIDGIVNILQPQLHAKDQRFDVIIRDISVENICCDSVRLTQILLNILGNSVKFTPEEGSICLSLSEENSPKGESYIRIHLITEDNGIGMTKEFQEKIFDSFTRADSRRVHKTEGSGLGMAITKYIVDAMGGTIQVESELGKGTRFHVILDLEKAQASDAEMILPGCRMLVVDDDPQLCETTVSALSSIGIEADWTLDADSALQMIHSLSLKQEEYQLILLDWKLPETDGITLTREIRRRIPRQFPILLTSAYDWNEIADEARAAGVTGFIPKPLFRSTLYYGLKPYLLCEDIKTLPAAEKNRPALPGKKILLAEDNELNWEIAYELLSELGLELDWAENGQICLEKFSQSPPGYYNAVLMDLRMPVMTGLEASMAIRALERPDAVTVPIIAMTADAFAEDIQDCLNSGMNAHISKPIDIDELTRLLEKYI